MIQVLYVWSGDSGDLYLDDSGTILTVSSFEDSGDSDLDDTDWWSGLVSWGEKDVWIFSHDHEVHITIALLKL